jgi:glucan 1,3-beta-glucosidase
MSRAALAVVLAALASALFFFAQGRPQPLADGTSEKVACVSYAPYTREQTPFDAKLTIPPAQIERDLAALSAVTSCVRTYATGQGLDKVPEIAARLGMKVYAGAWIGRKDADNQLEISRLLTAVNAHPETIRGLIVGNEVILRGEQTPEALIAYMNQVRAGLRQPLPITYADVWEFWERNPQLAQAADFVTIHLLPYWEDDPTPIDAAIRHVMAVWAKMRDEFAPKPILIGEVGWPSEGRRREGAEPSRFNQTRFVREFMAAAEKAGAAYNLIEALDQPWKRELEGTVGGAWGFFDADRVQKVFIRGPVTEWPDAARWAGAALALGLLPLLAALVRREVRNASAAVTLSCGGFAAGTALALQTRHMLAASRGIEEWTINGGWLAFSAALAWVLLRLLAGMRPADALPCACPRARFCPLASPERMRFVATVGMAISSLGLLFNARYRDFPVSMFLIAAVGFALVRLPAAPREQKAVALLLAAASIGVLINEGWLNTHAWLWAATGCILAAASFSGDERTTPLPRG